MRKQAAGAKPKSRRKKAAEAEKPAIDDSPERSNEDDSVFSQAAAEYSMELLDSAATQQNPKLSPVSSASKQYSQRHNSAYADEDAMETGSDSKATKDEDAEEEQAEPAQARRKSAAAKKKPETRKPLADASNKAVKPKATKRAGVLDAVMDSDSDSDEEQDSSNARPSQQAWKPAATKSKASPVLPRKQSSRAAAKAAAATMQASSSESDDEDDAPELEQETAVHSDAESQMDLDDAETSSNVSRDSFSLSDQQSIGYSSYFDDSENQDSLSECSDDGMDLDDNDLSPMEHTVQKLTFLSDSEESDFEDLDDDDAMRDLDGLDSPSAGSDADFANMGGARSRASDASVSEHKTTREVKSLQAKIKAVGKHRRNAQKAQAVQMSTNAYTTVQTTSRRDLEKVDKLRKSLITPIEKSIRKRASQLKKAKAVLKDSHNLMVAAHKKEMELLNAHSNRLSELMRANSKSSEKASSAAQHKASAFLAVYTEQNEKFMAKAKDLSKPDKKNEQFQALMAAFAK